MTANHWSHLEETLRRDIARIYDKVTEMCRLAEGSLQDCLTALLENDRQRAYGVILRDRFIDEKEKEIDRLCLDFLVRQQPVANQLRFIYSTIKINLELERVGDYAESIARQFLKLTDVEALIPKDRLKQIAELSVPMLRDAVQAFVNQDAELARKTIEVEAAVDGLKSKLNKDLVGMFKENKIPFEALNALMMITRRWERVSDQARNICMEVLYICTGESAKHLGGEAFRVIFVDKHHSCRSQMAEAIGNGLGQKQFLFDSAGLEPRPVDPKTIEFMRSKGYDLTRMASKPLLSVPHLDHCQVIVALDPEVQKAFPKRPRKVVYLDWTIEDPSERSGTSEEVHAAYEKAFQYIEEHLRDLLEAVLGRPLDQSSD